MTDKPITLKDFCVQYSIDHPESRRERSGSKGMYTAALKAGFACSQDSINNIRYQHGLGRKYEAASKPAAKTAKKSGAKRGRRRKYASVAAAAAAKYAANRVRREMARKASAPAIDPASLVVTSGKTSSSERAFLGAIAQLGLERAKALIVRFEKQATA